jgi:sugar/nucleoside kinase (ribokinase family)
VASFDISVIGELNLDLILYGLPQELKLEHEHLAKDLSITLGSSSAIFAHNLSSLGNKVAFSSCIGGDPFGEICIQRLGASGVDMSRVRRLGARPPGSRSSCHNGSSASSGSQRKQLARSKSHGLQTASV